MKIHDNVRELDVRKLRLEVDFQLGLVDGTPSIRV
jgi:hypothetical protein